MIERGRLMAGELTENIVEDTTTARELSDAIFTMKVMGTHILANHAANEIKQQKESEALVLGRIMNEIRNELEFCLEAMASEDYITHDVRKKDDVPKIN